MEKGGKEEKEGGRERKEAREGREGGGKGIRKGESKGRNEIYLSEMHFMFSLKLLLDKIKSTAGRRNYQLMIR